MEKSQETRIIATMERTLEDFKVIWKRILKTGEYEEKIEMLAKFLTTLKKNGFYIKEEEQFFEYAETFSNYLRIVDLEREVKKALKKVPKAWVVKWVF